MFRVSECHQFFTCERREAGPKQLESIYSIKNYLKLLGWSHPTVWGFGKTNPQHYVRESLETAAHRWTGYCGSFQIVFRES